MITTIVVDDDSATVQAMYDTLIDNNIKVLGKGYNGKEAVELYKKLKPDVTILDILMPEYDGHYAIKNIKEFDPSAKILVITADISDQTALELRDMSLLFLYKPYELEDLLNNLEILTVD